MDIQITGRRVKVTPAIESYVREKMKKAERYFDHVIWGQAFLTVDKNTHSAEILVHAAHQTFRALAKAADLYSAVDLSSDKIDIQLKKYKDRLKNHHKPHLPALLAAEAEAAATPSTRFTVFKQPVYPVAPEEAAVEMERLGQNFRLFENKVSGHICLVYRRDGDSYGILEAVRKGKP